MCSDIISVQYVTHIHTHAYTLTYTQDTVNSTRFLLPVVLQLLNEIQR